MPEGHEVVFEGEADESPDWEPGNVVLRVRSKKEKGGWRRKETSLYWKESIGIDEVCFLRIKFVFSQPTLINYSGFTGFPEEHNSSRWPQLRD